MSAPNRLPNRATSLDDIILHPGDVAPHLGVLVGESRYREFSMAVRELDIIKKNPVECPICECEAAQPDYKRDAIFSGGGLLIGLILGVMIVK